MRLVAAADKLHNALSILKDQRSLGDRVWARFSASKEEVLWYYSAVTRALSARGTSRLLEDLERAVGKMAREAAAAR